MADPTAIKGALSWINSEDMKKIAALYARREPIEPPEPIGPGQVALFSSKTHLEIWLLCMYLRITLKEYSDVNYLRRSTHPPKECLEPPKSAPCDSAHIAETFRAANAAFFDGDRITNKRYLKNNCRICHGSGVAYIIRGPLVTDNIPNMMTLAPCWCRR